ncbi:MAG: T9SS type A sorting domain-containing protein [Ignavibacteria bacterium]|nr:T9SS type A sorting domain-containing protein [Ignavibacteria bacterium]
MKTFLIIQFALIFQIQFSDLFSQTAEWRALPNSPVTSNRFEDIFFLNENTGWIIHGDGKVYRTTNAGQNWLLSQNVLNRCVGFFNSQDGIIGTLQNTRPLFKTTNGGINWIQITTLPEPVTTGICGISIVNENTAIACGTYSGNGLAYKTTDKGDTWSLIFSDTSKARSLVDTYFWSPDSGLIAGGYNTSTYSAGVAVVLMTTDGGSTWNTVHKTTRPGEWCWKINFYSRTSGVISIERNSGLSYILKTTNTGLNWTEIPFREYDQEGIGFLNDNTGWVGGWSGPTYKTTNGGTNWSLAGWGEYINRFRFLSDTLGYAAGDRVYKYSNYKVSVNQISSEIPNSYYLYQNYPNPFNPSTNIKFEMPKSGNAELKVFDAVGREVSVLLNENLSAGIYEYKFDAAVLPSGIYFYTLRTGEYIASRKMLLIK